MNKAKNSFGTFSDDTLAELSKNGDERAFNELVVRYLDKISSIARKYTAQGYEQSDFIQEGLIGMLYAVKTYKPGEGMSFKSYLSLVAERRFISIIRSQNTQKSVPTSALVELDGIDGDIVDLSQTPEEQIMLKEQVDLVKQRLREILSKLEYEVYILYHEGLSYGSISNKLGISEKSVDNALQRARKKIETHFSHEDP